MRVVPDDDQDFAYPVNSLWALTGGVVRYKGHDRQVRTVTVPDGGYLSVEVRRLYATGTTASRFYTDILTPTDAADVPYREAASPPASPPPPPPPPASAALALTQVETDVKGGAAFDTTPLVATLDAPPALGSLIVVAVAVNGNQSALVTHTVAGTAGVFTQVDGYARFDRLGSEVSVSLWHRRCTDPAADQTVTITPNSDCYLVAGLLELAGADTTPPVNASDTNVIASLSPAWTVGPVAAAAGELVLAAFVTANTNTQFTPGAGYTAAISHFNGSADETDTQLYVLYKVSAGGSETPTMTSDGQFMAAVAATIKE